MKKVLMIDERFPSTGGSRTEKFVKYLPGFGWEPLVLTINQMRKNPFAEEILTNYTSPNLKIYGTRTIPDFLILKRFNLSRIGEILNSFFLVPDRTIAWLPHAVRKGLEVIQKENPQIIYSTSPSEGVHLIAYFLKKSTRLPWVTDFRDLWTLYQERYKPRTFFHHFINCYIEKSLCQRWSDLVIANTEQNKNMIVSNFKVDPHKIEVITNGFDPDDAIEVKTHQERQKKMILGYLGAFEKTAICYREFLTGLANAIQYEKRFSVKLWSPTSDPLLSDIKKHNLTDHITFEEYVSHQACMKAIGMVDVLVVLLESKYPHVVPQKLYNYLAFNKLILAIVPPDGYAATVIRETNTGIIVSPDDTAGITEGLLELHHRWQKGKLKIKVNYTVLQKYRRDQLTKKLANVFDKQNS